MSFSNIVGNFGIKAVLNKALSSNTVAHAYLIEGQAGTGKDTLSRAFAAALVCGATGDKPCNTCAHCVKAKKEIHPDIIIIDNEGKDIIVDQVRKLKSDIWIMPNEADHKVYIIKDAQRMTPQAQNAMLKLLEDTPRHAVFILLCDNRHALLPTVLSRCIELHMERVQEREVYAYLKARFPRKDEDALAQAVRTCGGVIGYAVNMMEHGADEKINMLAEAFAAELSGVSEYMLMACAVKLDRLKREDFAVFLDALLSIVRDAIVYKSAQAAEGASIHVSMSAMALSAHYAQKKLLSIFECVRRYREACESNAGVSIMVGGLVAECWEESR